jgi:hypothetical protein
MNVFAANDPLPPGLRETIGAALESLSSAAKLTSVAPEESFDAAWTPLAMAARPRLRRAREQLRAADDPRCQARVARLQQFFDSLDVALGRLEAAAPGRAAGDASDQLKHEVNGVVYWLKLPASP